MSSANLTVLKDSSNASLLRWVVQLQNEDSEWAFECLAENEDHAIEQAMNAEPDAEVIGAALCERFFAMLDTEEVVMINGVGSIQEAIDNEPTGTHWVFSESGLKAFLKSAEQALVVPVAQTERPHSEVVNYQVTLQALVNVRVTMIDVCAHNRFFIGEITEINGDLEYSHRFPFTVPAGESLARVLLMIQVEERNGVPQGITGQAVDDYIANELDWEGDVGESDLWFDCTVFYVYKCANSRNRLVGWHRAVTDTD